MKAVKTGCFGYSKKPGKRTAIISIIAKGIPSRQFWRQDNHLEELIGNKFKDQKRAYIHNNPVEAGYLDEPKAYRYSSARAMLGERGFWILNFCRNVAAALPGHRPCFS